jgi:hypothetical protein
MRQFAGILLVLTISGHVQAQSIPDRKPGFLFSASTDASSSSITFTSDPLPQGWHGKALMQVLRAPIHVTAAYVTLNGTASASDAFAEASRVLQSDIRFDKNLQVPPGSPVWTVAFVLRSSKQPVAITSFGRAYNIIHDGKTGWLPKQ